MTPARSPAGPAGSSPREESLLHVKVVPGGSRDAVVGMFGDRLRVKVSAPAEGGKANRAVLELGPVSKGRSCSARRSSRCDGALGPKAPQRVKHPPPGPLGLRAAVSLRSRRARDGRLSKQDLVADRLGVPRSDLRIVQGETTPFKTIAVRGPTAAAALAALLRDAAR